MERSEKDVKGVVRMTKQECLDVIAEMGVKFLARFYHPHAKIIIDCDGAEVVEGDMVNTREVSDPVIEYKGVSYIGRKADCTEVRSCDKCDLLEECSHGKMPIPRCNDRIGERGYWKRLKVKK